MGVNNFKKLEELELKNISVRTEHVKNNIGANLGSLRFVTNIIELYFPVLMDLFVGLTGGSPGQINNSNSGKRNKYPDMG